MGGSAVRHGILALALVAGSAVRPHASSAQPPGDSGGPGGYRRDRLERLAELVQRRLALTDAQADRLRATSTRYGRDRQALAARQREARLTLRAEIPRGPQADQARVRAAIDALVASEQRRAALLAAEQRELASFLTPVQRAQYLGLQERALRAAERVRRARFGDGRPDSARPFGPGSRRRPRPE